MPHPTPSARTAAGAADRADGTVAVLPAPRVRVEHEGPVAVVVLEDPARRNVLGAALREQLHGSLGRLAEDPGVRAVVLTGAHGCFSAGGDLAAMPPAAPAEGRARMERVVALAFEAEHQPALFTTTDFLEGKQAFAERRAPACSGR
ncbi:enoyl-CoA hydratase/isomerase family protein [Kocuria flava]|uniref:enoyl-CoA hydratase/isomerase family protein n=1 Tax=Kocuria flava TaxID=446860 RepID=UPI001FF32C4F|nr:enoyl-CoA hydratase/isomerase family protein [Kocuria flava]MCJ8503946.1 enoyl-CoA hydratase/isomerase family protein [Kocuria flava]